MANKRVRNRKSYDAGFRLISKSVTFNDLERHNDRRRALSLRAELVKPELQQQHSSDFWNKTSLVNVSNSQFTSVSFLSDATTVGDRSTDLEPADSLRRHAAVNLVGADMLDGTSDVVVDHRRTTRRHRRPTVVYHAVSHSLRGARSEHSVKSSTCK